LTIYERRQQLLEQLRRQPGLRVPELAAGLQVSQGTVRNDLDALAQEGLLTRVRGGAVLADDLGPRSPAFATRARVNTAAKNLITRWASDLVRDGDSIMLDASTTVYHIARYIQDRANLTVITNGIEVARKLAQNPSNTVILIGGMVRSDGTAVTGALSEQFLKDFHVKTALVSCSGFTLGAGLTEVDYHEAQIKQKMITAAAVVVALIDSSKFGKMDLTHFARLDQISQIYTDCALDPAWVEQLKPSGVRLTLCSENSVTNYP
jgi:DeoR/GlpR family transcriptional regulator of sugar metabolism